jgi:hypothetical protein
LAGPTSRASRAGRGAPGEELAARSRRRFSLLRGAVELHKARGRGSGSTAPAYGDGICIAAQVVATIRSPGVKLALHLQPAFDRKGRKQIPRQQSPRDRPLDRAALCARIHRRTTQRRSNRPPHWADPDERMYWIGVSPPLKRSRHSSSGLSLTSTSTKREARATRACDQRPAPGPISNTAPAGEIQRASTSSISACFHSGEAFHFSPSPLQS